MEPSVGLTVAFVAGVLSFLSPCVLPLIPGYITFITGMGYADLARTRRTTMLHALAFVFGFSLIFIALGASATALGTLLLGYRLWISRIGGAMVILFGLHLLGVFQFRALSQDTRVQFTNKPLGYLGTVLVGIAFGAGWTPCIGPILGGILTLASMTDGVPRGMALLGVYSAGLAVPFLLSAAAMDRFLGAFQRVRPHLGWINRVSGLLLIAVGVLLISNRFTILAGYLEQLTPDALRDRL